MVGNTGTLMTMRIVRSKLRKREDSSATSVSTVTVEAQQSRSSLSDRQDQQILSTGVKNSGSTINSLELETITFARTSGSSGTKTNGWIFPPKAPSPNIYNCNHESMVASSERIGFKGFRKQFSGRFRRLVSKKETTSPIPPELKPQLKTIYVY